MCTNRHGHSASAVVTPIMNCSIAAKALWLPWERLEHNMSTKNVAGLVGLRTNLRGAVLEIPLRWFCVARATASIQCARKFRAGLLLRFCCALSPRKFRYVNCVQGQNKRCILVIMTLQANFDCDLEIFTALWQLLLRFMVLWSKFWSAIVHGAPSSGMGA